MKKKNTNPEIIKGLSLCFKIANILKEKYPNELMKITNTTMIPFKAKSRLCSNKSLGGSAAHYHSTKPHRICIQQKVLINFECNTCVYDGGRLRGTTRKIYGNFAMIDLMAHELGHHRSGNGHGKKFKIKYEKFLNYLLNLVISGKFYTPRT